MASRPLFIVFEGVDGSGKSTQIELLKEHFSKEGEKAYVTNEPTDSPIGSLIRNVMKGRLDIPPAAVAALFAADRLDHIDNSVNGMRKKRDNGYHIIASRYYFSNYAFQGEFVDIDWLVQLNRLAKETFPPDIIFYLNVDPKTCYQRIIQGRDDIELYETEAKIKKVHHAYLKHFKQLGQDENIVLIDANKRVEAIAAEIWDKVLIFKNKNERTGHV